jgi:DNA-binding SARP family transcriptional activator/tetratricopeptide (TPR) repeat protein
MPQPRRAAARLTLFGGPEVRGPGNEVLSLTPTHEALLTLLWGQEEQGLTRRRAIWLLWEDDDCAPSRHRLSQVLHELRGRLGIDPVTASGDDVLVAAWGALPSDLADYRVALRNGALQKALVAVERGFAPRLKRIPGEEYDDWITAKRASLRRELREVAARAWDEHQPRGAWRRARDAAEVLHALDRDSESALRNVVESRAMTGGFEAAEAAFTAFVDGIEEGSEIEAETRALIERVRRLSGERELGPPRDDAAPPPLVGRTHDLETARRMLDRVRGGGFEFLVLQGDAGIGKTRLLEEIRREAHIKGFRCMQARSVELERRIPLNPLIDALSHPEVGEYLRDLDDPWRAVIAALLPHLPEGMERPVVPPIAESSLSRRLFDAFSILFARLAENEPTILFLDDLQWADATTVAVLQFVQRRWRAGSLGVIGTIRPDMVAGNDGVVRYLEETDDLPVTRVRVGELDPAEALELVEIVSEGSLDVVTMRRLCALAGGNPFYIIELTKDYLGGQLLMPESPTDALTIPISLRQLVDPRIEALSDRAAQAASLLAIWGRWARLTDLAALVAMSPHDLIEDVEELERHRLVVVDRDQIRIAHELYRGTLYHRLGETRRAVLHRAIAEHLMATDQAQPGELAIHFARAGDRAKAARFGREAADAALENGAMAEAAYFLQVVIENEGDERLRAEATGDLASVLHMKREIARAIPISQLAASRLRSVAEHSAAIRMEIRGVEMLLETGMSPVTDLFSRLEDIENAASKANDAEAYALALDSSLHLLHLHGKIDEIRCLFSLMERVASGADLAAACVANASLAMDLLFGDGRSALSRAQEAVAIAEHARLASHLLRATERLVLVRSYQGTLSNPAGQDFLDAAIRRADAAGDLTFRFSFELSKGVAAMDSGALDQAEAQFERVASIVERSEPGPPHLLLAYNRAEMCIQQRRYVAALQWLERFHELRGPTTPDFLVEMSNAAAGICYLELGALGSARECEAAASGNPDHWYFDPTIILDFQTRLLLRRAQPRRALEILCEASQSIADRLTSAWIKLVLMECRIRRHTGSGESSELPRAIELATERGLPNRVQQLQEYAR